MIKILCALGLAVVSCHTLAKFPAQNYSYQPVYSGLVEYSQYNAELDDDFEFELKGVAFAISTSPHISGWYGKIDILQNDEFDMDYVETTTGAQISLLRDPNFYVLVTAGIGYAWMDSSYLYNDVQFFSLPVGVEVGMTPASNFSVYGGIGYKWLWDLTSSTTCRDGSTTDRKGRDACMYRGGFSYYNDTVGDSSGLTYKAGIRLNF